jgi:hypothetical protein
MPYTYVKDPDRPRWIALRLLKFAVDDDRLLEIFGVLARAVPISAQRCDDAEDDGLIDDEVTYIEELLGASFVLLQTKIRRVSEAAKNPLISPKGINIFDLDTNNYKGTESSFISLVWEMANYYKHSDEWSYDVWREKEVGEKESRQLSLSRKTRRTVERLGIRESTSRGRMRTAYDFFEINWASDCSLLAAKVKEWAEVVYDRCANPAL